MTKPTRTNKYAARCANCGQQVPAETGVLSGKPGDWKITHVDCPVGDAAPLLVPQVDFEPTAEQAEALALFKAGKSFLIEAGAGTGKTATLKLLAESAPNRHGAYTAFNKKIVEDSAASFPRTVTAKTVHAWAFATEGRRFHHRFQTDRQSSTQVARILRIEPFYCLDDRGEVFKVLQPGYLASLVNRAVKVYCNSEDVEPAEKHFAYIDGIDDPTEEGRRTYHNNNLVRSHLLPALQKAWADLSDEQGQLRYVQDAYVKLFALNDDTRIPADYILVDEAQDLSGVMVTILRKAREDGTQVVVVGDPAQTIYTWRGSVSLFDPAYADLFEGHTFLTQAWRFGQEIADVANLLLGKASSKLRLTGNPDRESTIGIAAAVDAVVTRTNAAAVSTFLDAIAHEKKPHLVGGGDDVARFCKGALELQQTGRCFHPELSIFSSWTEVQAFVTSDPEGEEIKLLVKLIDQFGADKILAGLTQQVPAAQADIVITTAHKSKGLQWDKVRLSSDFTDPGKRGNPDEEWRILYVAATRAKFHLDYTSCPPLISLLGPPEEALAGPEDERPFDSGASETQTVIPSSVVTAEPVIAPGPQSVGGGQEAVAANGARGSSPRPSHPDSWPVTGEPRWYIGRCAQKGCKHGYKGFGHLVVEDHKLVGFFDPDGQRVTVPSCPEHHRRVYLKPLRVLPPKANSKCNASCRNARKDECDCVCQGANHGLGHLQ